MMQTFLKFLCVFFVLHHGQLYAQDESSSMIQSSLNDLTVVGGCAAGGAVLGLSTLSFYAHPTDHYKNILYGAAVGLIVGVGLVVFSAATKTKKGVDAPGGEEGAQLMEFSAQDRLAWHYQAQQSLEKQELTVEAAPSFLTYSLSF